MFLDKKDFFLLGFVVGVVVSLILFISINFFIEKNPIILSQVVSPDECMNKSLFQSSKCALNYVKSFYEYNISNMGKSLTLNELKSEGGVCTHYSKIYDRIGKEAGFYTTEVIIWNSPNSRHIFSVWSNKEGYVILDQNHRVFVPLG